MNSQTVQIPKKLRFVSHFKTAETVSELEKFPATIGRWSDFGTPELDLTPDNNVSRQHARLVLENGNVWIEDLDSRFGTKLNGNEIKKHGRQMLKTGDVLQLGDTTLQLELSEHRPPIRERSNPSSDATLKITYNQDAKDAERLFREKASAEMLSRQNRILEFPVQLGAQTKLDAVLQLTLQRAMEMIPEARRGTLLLCARDSAELLLAAYVSSDQPAVSETLARRALARREGFIWRRSVEGDIGASVKRHNIESGIYAPLLWNGKPLGVLCVDNSQRESVFSADDLLIIVALAHYAAVSIANHQLQEDLRNKSKLLERLLTQFSPKIRERLLAKAFSGRLRPGGEKSDVAILFSDIRGFTNLSASMDASDVVDMLNDYFPALADAIFKHDGTIDKFIGDAILAVFGSPEPDPKLVEKAIRAALEMQVAMKRVNEKRAARGEPVCEIGIGVHFGEVLHGFIGAMERLEFTVIGDTVNRASRFCNGAKAGEILISPEIYQRVFKLIQSEKTTIPAKHEDDLTAYRVRDFLKD